MGADSVIGKRSQLMQRRAQEEDRARIAQTIHDHFGLLLMLLRARIQSAKGHIDGLSGAASISRDAALTELTAAETTWQQLLTAMRQLQNDLHPAPLDSHGLTAAFKALQRTFAGAGLSVALDAGAIAEERFNMNLETTAYWLTQHALTNALRHSGTDRATVTANIARNAGREALRILIEDNGKGFIPGEIGGTFGLNAMYDRVALIGGTVVIDSAPGRGTRVIIDLPTNMERTDGLGERGSARAERD